MDQQKIGLLLKELRKERALTQEQLAERFHVSDRTVSRWENGNNLPDLATLVALADFYGVDLRAMLDGERGKEVMNEEAKEAVARAADYAGEERRQALRRTRKRSRRNTAALVIALAVLLFPVLFLAGIFFGNPVSYLLARHNAKNYVVTHFGGQGFAVTNADYWFKDMNYHFTVEKEGSPDSTFAVIIGMTGNYLYDTSEAVLEGLAGTKSRMSSEYNALVRAAFEASSFYRGDDSAFAFGEILFAGEDAELAGIPGVYESAVRLDAQYDYALVGRTAGKISVSMDCSDLSAAHVAALLTELRDLFTEAGVTFACVDLLLTDHAAPAEEGAGYACAGVLDYPFSEIGGPDFTERVAARLEH